MDIAGILIIRFVQDLYAAVNVLQLLKEGSITSCALGDTVDDCRLKYCSILKTAGCCVSTLASFFNTGYTLQVEDHLTLEAV